MARPHTCFMAAHCRSPYWLKKEEKDKFEVTQLFRTKIYPSPPGTEEERDEESQIKPEGENSWWENSWWENRFSASVFRRMFSRTRPRGPISNTSRIRVDLRYVKSECGTHLDPRHWKKDVKGEHRSCCALYVKCAIRKSSPWGLQRQNGNAIPERCGAFNSKHSS